MQTGRPLTRREASASFSLAAFAFYLLAACPSPAADYFINDNSRRGDVLTRAPGDDSGDGSKNRPFLSLARALRAARPGDRLFFDSGTYPLSAPREPPSLFPLTLSDLQIEGAGPEKTFFEAGTSPGFSFLKSDRIRLSGFSIHGGKSSLLLQHCRDFSLSRIHTRNSLQYGILLADSASLELNDCFTAASRFRGLQLRRCFLSKINRHGSEENKNSGISLDQSSENHLRSCSASGNGGSGFYLLRKSGNNFIETCLAHKNGFVGFYLDDFSTLNRLFNNRATQNERGFTLSESPFNDLEGNQAGHNRSFGFWFKEQSHDLRLKNNRAIGNGLADFKTGDDPPATVTQNKAPAAKR